MSNKFLCNVRGGCARFSYGTGENLNYSVSGFGKLVDFEKDDFSSQISADAEIFRFLLGEKILSKNGCLHLYLSGQFLASKGIPLPGTPAFSSSEDVRHDPFAFGRLLKNMFEKSVAGKAKCEVQGVGDVDLRVEPDSWNVICFRKHDGSGENLFRVDVAFRCSIQLKVPVDPFAQSVLRDGVRYSRSLGRVACDRDNLRIAMGLVLCGEKPVINKSRGFVSLRPRNEDELKYMLAREVMYDFDLGRFAELASLLAKDGTLKKQLSWNRSKDSFPLSDAYLGHVSKGMFMGVLRTLYPNTPCVHFSLKKALVKSDLFESALPAFLNEMNGFRQKLMAVDYDKIGFYKGDRNSRMFVCGKGLCVLKISVPERMPDGMTVKLFQRDVNHLLDDVTVFCEAILKFYRETLVFGEDFLKNLLDLAWAKVALDPLSYVNHENPLLSKFAACSINGLGWRDF